MASEDETKTLTPEKREIVRMITENLKNGAGMWRQNWFSSGAPRNASTRKPYRGVNNVYLTLLAMKRGYSDNRWVTYNQMKNEGWRFKEREGGWAAITREGASIEFFELRDRLTGKPVDKSTLSGMSPSDRKRYLEIGVRATKKVYRVYNVEMVEGPQELDLPEEGRSERAEKMIEYWSDNEAEIVYGGNDSYYSPPSDTIFVPARESFIGYGEFYNTIFHEIAHSTGAQGRMGRHFYTAGTRGYAVEEMRAEVASLFLSQEFGAKVASGSARNSSAYIQSWMEAFRDDPNAFFDAVYDAQDIARFVAGKEAEADKMTERKILIPPSQYMREIDAQGAKPLALGDEEIVKKARADRGGEKFATLFEGRQLFADEERNDEIFFLRLALYTSDKDQLKRIYKSSKRRRRTDRYLEGKIETAVAKTEEERARTAERLKNSGKSAGKDGER